MLLRAYITQQCTRRVFYSFNNIHEKKNAESQDRRNFEGVRALFVINLHSCYNFERNRNRFQLIRTMEIFLCTSLLIGLNDAAFITFFVSSRAKEKEKQGVQLPGSSGPKASRTSPNFFRFQTSLTSALKVDKRVRAKPKISTIARL